VGGAPLADITSLIGGITGGLTSALSFSNIKLNLFGCELKPNAAVSDYYTFARGGAAQPDSQLPSNESVAQSAKSPPTAQSLPEKPYAEPTKAQSTVVP